MTDTITQLFGEGPNLTILQMTLRALVMFFLALLLIRFAGIRIFGMGSAFDNGVAIMLGSLLSRGIVGASPFWPVVAAACCICLVHKLMARLGVNFHFISVMIKGRQLELYKDGRINKKNLKTVQLTENDLLGEIRLRINSDSMDDVKAIYRERTGQISVVL